MTTSEPAPQTSGTAVSRGPTSSTSSETSLGELVSSATADLSALVRAEVQLAKTEISKDVKAAGIGAGMFGGAGFLGLLAVLFLSVALAEGLEALFAPRWLGYLIVAALYLVVAGLMALIGKKKVSQVGPPERTIRTVKDDVAWAKNPTEAPTRDLSRG